ncbi:hypothetical protein VP01_977g4 [Puccinia sorghi]|uniref:DUF7872 domain-containing protein n=1 Tax=Puccinia sorghi TaxID=27349 RepID=A0A0L6U7Y1_9BASI|nr:hypothetical protein VP01_977g4 [Puccinia sorghi]
MGRRSLQHSTRSPENWLLLASAFLVPVHAGQNPGLTDSTRLSHGLARRSLVASPANINITNPAPSTVQPQPTAAAPASSCVQPPLTNTTWIQLGIDNYLANLPNGTSMNLQHYAASVGAPNFICGIGEKCQAGQLTFPLQLCSPVQAPGWEVLVAAQEWNNFQNKFYEAVGTAIQLVTSVSSALVVDLYPPRHTGEIWDIFNSFNLAAGITAAVTGGLAFIIGAGAIVATPLALLTMSAIAVTFGTIGVISIQEALKKRGPNAFDKKHAQKSIANETRSIIAAGVSSPQGISTVLKNGTFFQERPLQSEAELVASLKNTTTVRIMTDILRNQGAFVTIASDKCTSKGPGGAWKGDDKLSYCSPNGTMFNIIHSRKKKVDNKWWNADLISKKYGISVQYLTEQSYFCQINHGVANFDPYKSG